MVPLKGKSRLGSTRASVGDQSRPSVSGKNFKVFWENDRIKAGDGLIRSAVIAKKGVIPNRGSNPKGGFKDMEKSSGRYGTSENINVRKALADVSNVKGNSATTAGRDSSKMKFSSGSSTKIVGVSLRKSLKGRVQRNTGEGDVKLDAPNRGTDLRTSFNDQKKNNTSGGQSVVVTKDRSVRKPVLSTTTSTSRMSLPVPRRVNRADMSNTKDIGRCSETAKVQSGLPTKATTGSSVSSQLINARSQLWKTRMSDGFVQKDPQQSPAFLWAREEAPEGINVYDYPSLSNRQWTEFMNKEICKIFRIWSYLGTKTNILPATSRKSIKPIVKTTLRASTAQRTSQSKSLSSQNKSKSTAATSSQDDEKVSLPLTDNGSAIVSVDANQRHLPSDEESNLRTDLSGSILRKKSTRRKSYTTSLLERSKFLKDDDLPNIDNESNQLEVSEYIDEIYHYYWVTEAHNPAPGNYMSIQTEITPHMRGILINWLIEVHYRFDLMPETLYLTVTLLDQYLSLVTIKTTDMQLVGLTALLLASKYEDFWHPRVEELIGISAESYTRDQMLEMEKLILRKLKFRLNAPTPYVFMVRFLKAAQSDMKLEHMAFYLIDLCLVEYEALAFKPSLLCASAIYVARCTLQITPPWTPLLQKHARYEVSQIRGCAEMILKFHKGAGVGKLKVTYEKYSRQNLSRVAAVKPLDRLPM